MMNNNEKIEYIVTHYTKLMHSAANSVLNDYHEAEDACQEAFLKLYKVIDKLEEVSSTRTRAYCVTTARNIAVNMARKKAKQIPYEELPEVESNDGFTKTSTAEAEDLLQDIEELPEKYRNIIRLRCFEERSAEETAEMLNSNVSTVNSQLIRAKKKLRNKWVSIACLLCALCLLVAGTLASGLLRPEVNYSTLNAGTAQDQSFGEGSAFMENKAAEALDAEEYAAPASGTALSESGLYKELDGIALKEVEGAAESNITARDLLEENETGFVYQVTICFDGKIHLIKMKISGEIISHEISTQ